MFFMDEYNSNEFWAAKPQEVIDPRGECAAVVLLEQEKKTLEVAVRRLEASNIELREALNEECNDPIYKEAIGVGACCRRSMYHTSGW